jgi:hypothetical protein
MYLNLKQPLQCVATLSVGSTANIFHAATWPSQCFYFDSTAPVLVDRHVISLTRFFHALLVYVSDLQCFASSVVLTNSFGTRVWTATIQELKNVYWNISNFWDITPCFPSKVSRCFEGACRLHLQVLSTSQARNQQETISKQANCFMLV